MILDLWEVEKIIQIITKLFSPLFQELGAQIVNNFLSWKLFEILLDISVQLS